MKKTMKMVLAVAAICILPAAANAAYVAQPDAQRQGAIIFEETQTLDRNSVAYLQRMLTRQNFYTSSIDGVWGPKTTAAVRLYQQSRDMAPTGMLSAAELSELGVNIASSSDASELSDIAPAAGDEIELNSSRSLAPYGAKNSNVRFE